MSILSVKNLNAGYGKIQVLWDINFEINEGEFITLIGANGAGKTTLLRSLSGLIPVRSGSITAFGTPIKRASAAQIVRAGIGHVPEGRQLFHQMTVRENLDSGADYLKNARAHAPQTRAFVYELFPRLQEREKQLAGTLSGGERQMLAIGRALMSKPKILLIDEPSLGLAPALTQTVFRALKYSNEQGVTTLLVEQNVRQSLQLADRAYVLDNGRITKTGTGASLLNDPDIIRSYLSM